MTKLNIHEAKTHLSKYLQKVQEGETITLCKNGIPVAQITPIPKSPGEVRSIFGTARGMGKVTEKFFEPLTDQDLPGVGL